MRRHSRLILTGLVAVLIAGVGPQRASAQELYFTLDDGTSTRIQRANIEIPAGETPSTRTDTEDLVVGLPTCCGVDIVLDLEGDKMYWTALGTLQRANLEIPAGETAATRTDIEDLVAGQSSVGMALDVAAGKMYWTQFQGGGKIQRANLDGTGAEDLLSVGAFNRRGISLDLAGNKMYWVDGGAGKIQRANLTIPVGETASTRTDVEDLVIALGTFDPFAIALDVPAGKMYFTRGSLGGATKIQRANLDGTAIEDLVTVPDPPLRIALDLVAREMYWVAGNKIQKAGVEIPAGETAATRTDIEDLVVAATGGFGGIAIDPGQSISSRIYWGDNGADKIQRANLDGTGVEDLVTGVNSPSSIAVDVVGGKVYWGEEGGFPKKIQRANLDGTQVEDLVTFSGDPRALALDLQAGKVYWTDNSFGLVRRANLDGTGLEDVVTGLDTPTGIALDLDRDKVYWIENSGSILPTKIRRANLSDGGNAEDVIEILNFIPFNLALDATAGKIYWTELSSAKIQRASIDGTALEDVVTGLATPVAIALDLRAGKIYWTDQGSDKIQRADLDGSAVEDLVTGLDQPSGVALELPLSMDGLAAHWPFDDGQNPTADVIGGQDGTLLGGASFVVQDLGGTQDDLAPLVGNGDAISLPVGTNAFVSVGDPPELQITGDLTITAWVRPAPTNTIDHLVTRRAGCGAGIGYQLVLDRTNELAFSDGDSFFNPAKFSGLFVPDNQWSFVASVFHADADTLDFYVNDSSVLGVVAAPLGDPSGADVQIGQADGCAADTHFDGLVDDVRIFAAALSPAEIDTLFRGNLLPLPPIADAGPDQAVECVSPAGGLVTLDGSGSSDPNGDPIVSYEWRDAGGSLVGSEAQVDVSLPLGSHTITLTVEDSTGASASDTMQVAVFDITPPRLEVPLTSITVVQTTGIGAFVDVVAASGAVALDLCDPNPAIETETPFPSAEFPLGVTEVQVFARDVAGNESPRITVTVEVLSSTPITDLGTLGGGSHSRAISTISGWLSARARRSPEKSTPLRGRPRMGCRTWGRWEVISALHTPSILKASSWAVAERQPGNSTPLPGQPKVGCKTWELLVAISAAQQP